MRVPRLTGVLAALMLAGAVEACWLTASLNGGDASTGDAGRHDAYADVVAAKDSGSDGGHADANPADARQGHDAGDATGDAIEGHDAGDARGEDAGDASQRGDTGTPTHDAESRYRALIVDAGPLVYFRLGESTGSSAQNEINLAEPGTYQAAVLRQDGAIVDDPNTAARFGDGGCLQLGGVSDLTFSQTDSVTIEMWINPTVIDTGYRNIFYQTADHNGKPDTFALFVVQGSSSHTISFERHQMGNATTATVIGDPPLNTFTHVAAVYDSVNEKLLLYLNGTMLATTTSPGQAGGTISGGATVACGGGGPIFVGTIDEIAVYARALSATEIANHYGVGHLDGG